MRRTTIRSFLLVVALWGAVLGPLALAARASSTLWTSSNGLLTFRSDRDGEPDVFTVDATGANATNLTQGSNIADKQPAWSPDGRRIAFVRHGANGRPDLYVMNEAGGGRVRLTSTPVPERDPAWSPDGTRIAFAARTGRSDPFRIFVTDADGTGTIQLTSLDENSSDRSPAWSPDGSRIAFVSDRDGGFPEVYVMNADGSALTRLTANGFVDGNPSWSPDGTRIAVERCCADGSSEIYAIDVVTHAETNLTNSASFMDFDPSWSPDGTAIAFVSFMSGEGNIDVWTMSADGTNQVRLTTETGLDLSPDWQPLPTCTISGTGQPDTLLGTSGNDVICGLAGADQVAAGDGHDLVFGGKDPDVLDGGPDFDLMDGGQGSDTCVKGADGGVVRLCEI